MRYGKPHNLLILACCHTRIIRYHEKIYSKCFFMMKKNMFGKGIGIFELENKGDERGCSYNIPQHAFNFIGEIRDSHFATIVPGAIRGNHYHVGRKEFILIWFCDSWILAWDYGDDTNVEIKSFSGAGLKLIEIDEEISHAIKNTGNADILIIAFSNKIFNFEKSDTYKRVVIL
jgi:dTDP-4-dehydrorhamnose 3,5-epimerase-like enzyme